MNSAEFDYNLPKDLIAQSPVEPRDTSRLMVINRGTGSIEHRRFTDLLTYLKPDDALVINRTRVIPARLRGVRVETGGQVEVVLIREQAPGLWEALLRPGARLLAGTTLRLEAGALQATVVDQPGPESRLLRFAGGVDVWQTMERVGQLPLPPYISRNVNPEDRIRYQTVYADEAGAIAAPTAGLHFTDHLLNRIRQLGVSIVPLLLHVGPGTFRPLRSETIEEHTMDPEYYRVEAAALREIIARRLKGKIIAVGTTTVRTLETIAADTLGRTEDLPVQGCEGWTTCYIHPPYRFQLVDALVTNFHLPRSTLLMLVCAFGGRDLVMSAYEEAVREQYRFYSYGDAMLVV